MPAPLNHQSFELTHIQVMEETFRIQKLLMGALLDDLVIPDDEFLAALQKLNGIPSEVLRQPEAIQLLLPIVRADFEAIETYQYISDHPLGVPIVALGGSHDPRVSRDRLEGWSTQTSSGFKSYIFDGDHFFIHTEKEKILDLIQEELT